MAETNNDVVIDPAKGRKIEAGGAVFWVRPPDVPGRTAFRRALSRHGVRTYDHSDMERAFERGIKAVYADQPEERDRLVALLKERGQRVAAFYDRVRRGEYADEPNALVAEWVAASAMGDALDDAEIMVARHHEPYREMCAEREVYPVAMGFIAAGMFLVGWEGVLDRETGQPVEFPAKEADIHARIANLSNEQIAAIGEAVDGMCDVKPSKVKR